MENMNLLNIVTIISLFISLFLAFFLITAKTEHKSSNVLLALFLVINAIDVSNSCFSVSLGLLRAVSLTSIHEVLSLKEDKGGGEEGGG